MKYRYWRAIKEAMKFTGLATIFMALCIVTAVGTAFAVDAMPLVEQAKVVLTPILWVLEICFVVAFLGSFKQE